MPYLTVQDRPTRYKFIIIAIKVALAWIFLPVNIYMYKNQQHKIRSVGHMLIIIIA